MAKGEKRKSPSHSERERPVAEAFVRALREGRVESLRRWPDAGFEQNRSDPPDVWLRLFPGGVRVGVEMSLLLPADGRFQKARMDVLRNPGAGSSWNPTLLKDVRDRVEAKATKSERADRHLDWLLLHEPLPEDPMYPYCHFGPEAHREVREGLADTFAKSPFALVLLQTSNLGQDHWSVVYDRKDKLRNDIRDKLREAQIKYNFVGGEDLGVEALVELHEVFCFRMRAFSTVKWAGRRDEETVRSNIKAVFDKGESLLRSFQEELSELQQAIHERETELRRLAACLRDEIGKVIPERTFLPYQSIENTEVPQLTRLMEAELRRLRSRYHLKSGIPYEPFKFITADGHLVRVQRPGTVGRSGAGKVDTDLEDCIERLLAAGIDDLRKMRKLIEIVFDSGSFGDEELTTGEGLSDLLRDKPSQIGRLKAQKWVFEIVGAQSDDPSTADED